MKTHLIAAMALLVTGTAAIAQSETPTTSQTTPAIALPGKTNPGAPIAGKNSFTRDQATDRIAAAGFTDVAMPILDDQGVWRSMAKKDGAAVDVSVDFQGNVTITK